FVVLFFFFFSSRRRHTRCLSDWSSDVCSSDLLRALKEHVAKTNFTSAENLVLATCSFSARKAMIGEPGSPPAYSPGPAKPSMKRSEERRVGKECRARRCGEDEREKESIRETAD